jgi:hypothetical protein
MKLGDAGMANLDAVKKFGDDPDDGTAAIYGTIRHPAHQAAASATIDKSQPVAGDHCSKVVGDIGIKRLMASRRAGKNTDFFHDLSVSCD